MGSNLRVKVNLIVLVFAALTLSGCEYEKNIFRQAPHFLLKDIMGNEVALDHYRGKVVLVDFWATWCPPCRKSIPELIALQDKFGSRGMVVLGISVDNPEKVSNEVLAAFKERFKMNYPILRASEKVVRDYFDTEEIAIPTMFVVNRKGQIAEKHVGFRPGAVEESIRKLLP